MDKIDTNLEDYKAIENEGDPFSQLFKEIITKLNEVIDWINNQ